jgi:hypothetical protein
LLNKKLLKLVSGASSGLKSGFYSDDLGQFDTKDYVWLTGRSKDDLWPGEVKPDHHA